MHDGGETRGGCHQVECAPSRGKADIGEGEGEAIVGEEQQVVITTTGATPTSRYEATPAPRSGATPTWYIVYSDAAAIE